MLKMNSTNIMDIKTELIAIPVCEDKNIYNDPAITALVEKTKNIREFKGLKDDEIILYSQPGFNAERILFLGIGKEKDIKEDILRSFSGSVAKKCIKKKISESVIIYPDNLKSDIPEKTLLSAMFEGALLGNHIFDNYKNEKNHSPLKSIAFAVSPEIKKQYKKTMDRITHICEGTIIARDWINTPSNDKKPEQFTQSILELAEKEYIKTTVLNEHDLLEMGFGALLAVAAGSESKPRLLILDYHPKTAKDRKPTVLVGKGVTFDSGGINLKPSGSLEDMKMDMAGAASVGAILITLSKIKYKKRVIGIIPVVENMLSGNAARPGDIIKSYSGKTIEIGNTDAEGRLILVDSISYAIKNYDPGMIIDLATLTGACVVALGEKIAGVFSADDELAESILLSGRNMNELCWRMPLHKEYSELLKSDYADIHNMSSSRYGGAITAALFLSEFTGEMKWAHIDIAGPAFQKKESPYCGAGGTGFGVRLICDLLEKI